MPGLAPSSIDINPSPWARSLGWEAVNRKSRHTVNHNTRVNLPTQPASSVVL